MGDVSKIVISGVLCVTVLIVVAVCKGLDGTLFASGIAAIVALISGFGGYKAGVTRTHKELLAGKDKERR